MRSPIKCFAPSSRVCPLRQRHSTSMPSFGSFWVLLISFPSMTASPPVLQASWGLRGGANLIPPLIFLMAIRRIWLLGGWRRKWRSPGRQSPVVPLICALEFCRQRRQSRRSTKSEVPTAQQGMGSTRRFVKPREADLFPFRPKGAADSVAFPPGSKSAPGS